MTSQGRSAGSSRGGLGGGLPAAFLSTGTSSFIEFLSDYAPEMLPGGRTPPATAAGEGVPHGTTVVAAVFPGGVVVAGDRRSTAANMIAQRDVEKVFRADDLSAIGYAGTAGIGVELIRIFQLELEHYEKMEGRVLSLQGKANRLATLIRNNLAMALQGLAVVPVFAGYDTERGTGRIFGYDASGGPFEELGFHAIGSGSVFARGALKKLYRDDLSERDTALACVHALYDAADDDSATGGPDLTRRIYPLVAAVTADGYRRLDDDEMAEIVRSVVDGRMDAPGGPQAPLH